LAVYHDPGSLTPHNDADLRGVNMVIETVVGLTTLTIGIAFADGPLTTLIDTAPCTQATAPGTHTWYVNESDPTNPGFGTYLYVPSGFITTVPFAGCVTTENTLPGGTEPDTDPATEPDTDSPVTVTIEDAKLPATVMVTVAIEHGAPPAAHTT
jgi:hypothetical protein